MVRQRTEGPAFGGNDIGARLVRARITDASTLTFSRGSAGVAGFDDFAEISYQVVELVEGSRVQSGTAVLGTGSLTPALSPAVRTHRTVGFASTRDSNGQSGGETSYTASDVPGVGQASVTVAPTQLNVGRYNAAAAASIDWFAVEFADN